MKDRKSPARMLADLILGKGKGATGRIDNEFAIKIAASITETEFRHYKNKDNYDDENESGVEDINAKDEEYLIFALFHVLNNLLLLNDTYQKEEVEKICEAIDSLLPLCIKDILEKIKRISSQKNLIKGEEAYETLVKHINKI